MVKRYGLRDDQFVRIENHLPGRPGHVGRNSEGGNRLFVEAVIWKFRSGAPWRDLPERFGDWKNTHRRFSYRRSFASRLVGHKTVFGRIFSKSWRMTPTMNTR